MNIVEQRLSPEGLYIRVSNGREVLMRSTTIKTQFDNTPGRNRTEKNNYTVNWIRDTIVKALGEEMISLENMNISFNELTGEVTISEISSEREFNRRIQ